MSQTIHIRANISAKKLTALVKHVQAVILGKEIDKYGFAKRFWGAVAHSMFTSIYDAFLIKSSGGTDELGFKWIDLHPKTKAYSRPDARRGLHLPGPKSRPTLTPAQDRAWRGLFVRLWHRLELHMDSDSARDIAAASAWIRVKDFYGATTLIEMLRDAKLPILNKTGALQASLFPAPLANGTYSPINPDQVYRATSGSLTIGSKLPYAAYVDEKRPLWPDKAIVWVDRATAAGRDALHTHLPTVIKQLGK